MSVRSLVAVTVLLAAASAQAQDQEPPCAFLCAPAFNVEPTLTVTNLFGSPRVVSAGEAASREQRGLDFEIILAVGLPTRVSWLGFTVEAIVMPFDRESTPELEFETNLTWLSAERTGGWVSSHVDVVDKFSPAERPTDRAYTHKLNLELDTAVHLFSRLPAGRWLRDIELEGSLDYVATGLARAGDRTSTTLHLDDASPWSFSIVLVLPVAGPR